MVKKLVILIILCIGLIYPINTQAKTTLIKEGEDHVISSDYTFTPRFITDVTETELSETYQKAESTAEYKKAYRNTGYTNYWVKYKNVGIWEQHTVDLKITLIDVVDTNPDSICTEYDADGGETSAIKVYFGPLVIAVSNPCLTQGAMGLFKTEFFDNETGEELSDIKTDITYTDIDYTERILLDNNKVKEMIYYTPYAEKHLELVNDNFNNRYTFFNTTRDWTCNGDNTCTNFKPEECYERNCDGCTKAGMITTLNDGTFNFGWSGSYTGLSSTGFLRIEDPSPIVLVDKENIKLGEELNYTIEQYVPNQASNHYYKSWKITDILDDILETSMDNINIQNDSEEDVTDKFNISLENNVLTVSAKEDYLASNEFYSKTFLINVKTQLNNNSQNKNTITNKATLNVQYSTGASSEDLLSNEVQITIEKEKEVIQIPNTSKFTDILILITGIALIGSGVYVVYKLKNNLSV